MEFGITWAKIDDMEYVARAEALGYTHLWVTDSQTIRSECFAVLTMAALKTRSMKLGVGVAVPGLRLAPVVANGIATINRIAPGRTFVALGTGYTAMRMLGRRPMRLKDFAAYVKVVRGLIRGEEVDYPDNGVNHKVRFMLLDKGYINVQDHIPLYLAGDGPKVQALAGELAEGLVTMAIPRAETLRNVIANVGTGAERSARTLGDFYLMVRANLVVLKPGEAVNSDRIVDEIGPALMTMVHHMVDRQLETGADPPEFLKPIWKDYLAFHMGRPQASRQQMMHEGHNVFVKPEERRFITPEMIKAFCMISRPQDVADEVRELQRQGVRQIKCNFPPEGGYKMMEDFSRDVIEKM